MFSKLEIEDEPTEYPIVVDNTNEKFDQEIDLNALLVAKYKTITPSEIAEKIISICESEKVKATNAIIEIRKEELYKVYTYFFIQKAAEQSTKRYEEGKSLSVIDGVPFFIKEHISIENYTTYYGCSGLNELSTKTAFCIRKLFDKGAILIGTTTMPQIGSNPIGFNPSRVFPSPRNPWNTNRYTGGSSSGNGVVVGMGLCPFAIGSDALGSIRVPSGFCGIVGLRSTFSRVSNKGATSLDLSAFLVIGPMACCVGDAAIVHAIISGPDEEFSLGINQPCYFPPIFENYSLGGKKFGICMEYISNADDCSISCFNDVCDMLRSVDSQIIDLKIPELLETSAATCAGLIQAIHESILSDENNIILNQSVREYYSLINLEGYQSFTSCRTRVTSF
ncbi:hypothetical protein MXB_1401 [Myxobolus squamalis]|nr:hypothetical protein MXB_1401 [Myxobolus squamalis]